MYAESWPDGKSDRFLSSASFGTLPLTRFSTDRVVDRAIELYSLINRLPRAQLVPHAVVLIGGTPAWAGPLTSSKNSLRDTRIVNRGIFYVSFANIVEQPGRNPGTVRARALPVPYSKQCRADCISAANARYPARTRVNARIYSCFISEKDTGRGKKKEKR